jgi:tetratricopeptide (TPR) repeat protein
VIYGRILYLARRFDDADLQFKRVVEIFPQWSTAYGWIWLVYEIRGDHENAFKWLVANQERNNAPAERIRMFKDAWEKAGWLGVGEKLLEVERPQNNTGNYYAAARHATRLGDLDLAIEYLNRSFDLRQYQMTWLKVDPYFDPLRGDPRYDLLVERVGLS